MNISCKLFLALMIFSCDIFASEYLTGQQQRNIDDAFEAVKGDDLGKFQRSLVKLSSADIDGKDRQGRTLLFYAVGLKKLEFAKELLIKNGAATNIDCGGQCPLSLACNGDSLEMLELLLSRGAQPHAQGEGYLARIIRAKKTQFIKPLMQHSDRKRLVEAVCVASGSGNLAILTDLLAHGGDELAQASSDNKTTPLHEAVKGKHRDCILLLMGKGARVLVKDSLNKTPLDYAIETNDISRTPLLASCIYMPFVDEILARKKDVETLKKGALDFDKALNPLVDESSTVRIVALRKAIFAEVDAHLEDTVFEGQCGELKMEKVIGQIQDYFNKIQAKYELSDFLKRVFDPQKVSSFYSERIRKALAGGLQQLVDTHAFYREGREHIPSCSLKRAHSPENSVTQNRRRTVQPLDD